MSGLADSMSIARNPHPLLARRGRLLIRLAAAIAGVVAVKSFVVDPLSGHFGGTFEDFSAYMGAARSMAHGGSPYAQFDPRTVVMSGFIYPPFAAVITRPLALLADRQALVVWLALALACSVAGAIILARATLPAAWPRNELAVLAALAFAPSAYNFWHGQINPLIFLLLAMGCVAYMRDRELLAGITLGLAAGIKLAPLILVVLLLRRRWWRGSATLALTALATACIGLAGAGISSTRFYFATVFPLLSRPTGWLYNQSMPGMISRLGDQSVLRVAPAPASIQIGCLAAGAAIVGLAAWATRPEGRDRPERGLEFGLGVTAMLLAGSIAWFPHFTHLLIPLFAVLGFAAARGARADRVLNSTGLITAVVFGLVAPLAISHLDIDWIAAVSRSPAWWPFLQVSSIPCLVAVAFAVAMARSLRARSDPGALTRC